jgi:hypothetical protein
MTGYLYEGFDPSDEEAGSYSEEVDRPTTDELKAAAEIIVYLEESLRLDTTALRIRVKDGLVRIYGVVESAEERDEVEKCLQRNSTVKGLEMNVSVRD